MSARAGATGNDRATSPDGLLGRVTGMLAGVAVGDAIGMPAEMLEPATIVAWYGRITGPVAPDARHPHHRLPAGSVTDDTDHTLLLADLLVERGTIDPEALAAGLLAWGTSERVVANRFVGPSTTRVLEALKAGVPIAQLPRAGTSSGACMRMAPLAICFPDRDDLAQQVVASCSVSHHTRAAISGAMAMAFALSAALEEGADVTSVAHAAGDGAVRGREHGDWSWTAPIERRVEAAIGWAGALSESETLGRLYDLIGVDMYGDQLVPDAVALTALAAGDPGRAVLLAANLGGDTDTLASMAGSLAGALWGVTGFDPAWVELVERTNGIDLAAIAGKLLAIREAHA